MHCDVSNKQQMRIISFLAKVLALSVKGEIFLSLIKMSSVFC